MAAIDVSVNKELLSGLLGGQDGLAQLVDTVLNQILQAKVSEALGRSCECSDVRVGYRHGHHARVLTTHL